MGQQISKSLSKERIFVSAPPLADLQTSLIDESLLVSNLHRVSSQKIQ